MSHSNTWYHGGQGQNEVAYQYPQPDQYHQQPQYNHQPYYPQEQQHQYQPQQHWDQSHQTSYNTYNDHSQWNYQQHPYDDRSFHQTGTSSVPLPPPPQTQQYTPAHAPIAPPTATQAFGKYNDNAHYQYSDLHGRKKALMIGINYFGTQNELQGCINDVNNVKDFLIQSYGFRAENMWIMTDDLKDPQSLPTRQNILTGLRWLVQDAKPGDNLFLHYSGHGGPVADVDGDEDDGTDEAIFPMDCETVSPGYIIDDTIHDICVKPLPEGCRLTAIFDCCHSGSVMDLPYMYSTKGVLKEPSLLRDTSLGLLSLGNAYVQHDMGGMIVNGAGLLKRFAQAASGHHRKVKEAKTAAADVICFSGCKDTQLSMDANLAGQRQGAMSHAFKTSLFKYGGNLTYIQLLNAIRQELTNGGYEQKPQLSCCHPLDLDLLFTL